MYLVPIPISSYDCIDLIQKNLNVICWLSKISNKSRIVKDEKGALFILCIPREKNGE